MTRCPGPRKGSTIVNMRDSWALEVTVGVEDSPWEGAASHHIESGVGEAVGRETPSGKGLTQKSNEV